MADAEKRVNYEAIMNEWVRFGDEEENPYMRFMAYWIVFNMLYFKTEVPVQPNGKRPTERDKIRCYYFENKNQFRQYNPFSNGDADLFYGNEFFAIHHCSPNDERARRWQSKIKAGNHCELILAVYKIRCNYVHGNKRLGDKTDRKLVDAGATIIRGYLGTFNFLPDATSNTERA